MSMFQKAVKTQAKARIGLIGPSGSGKTYTALLLAKHLGGRTALIDTEHGSASKYADEFEFDTLALETFHPQHYIDAIKAAGEEGYDNLIIDSLSHAWAGTDGALELADRNAARYKDNRWAAWRDVTPLHNKLIEAMLASPCHLVATMRSKMAYVQTTENGKTVIRKVGMEPVQRDGMEYEFDVVGDLDLDHNLVISKTRCRLLDGAVINKPSRELAETVKAWLSDGAPVAEKPKPIEQAKPATPVGTAPRSANAGKPAGGAKFAGFWTSAKNIGCNEEFVHKEAAAYFNVPNLTSLDDVPGLDQVKLGNFLLHLRNLVQQRSA